MKNNFKHWDAASIVDFFDSRRDKQGDVYPSEWFFLKDQIRENISVLDVGCAQGGFSQIFSNYLKSFNYVGMDISLNMIERARSRFPQHLFLHCSEGDYSNLNNKKFDLVLVLGIIHLHEGWRNTISKAWEHTAKNLILDFRETELPSIEDKNISFFNMEGSDYPIPYNIINTAEALSELIRLCPGYKKICRYGYIHPISESATSPIRQVMTTVYSIER